MFLYKLEDKEITIKMNRNNIINYYIDIPDLWVNKNFKLESMNLKKFNVQINQVLSLYEFLGGDIDSSFCDDVREQIKQIEEMKKPKPTFEENQSNVENIEEIKKEEKIQEDDDDDYYKKNDEDEDDEEYGGRD